MGDSTAISWADKTFNIWIGCEHAPAGPGMDGTSPECDNCYAEQWDRRDLHGDGTHWGPDAPRRFLSDAYWRKPLAWNAEAERRGIRYRVFCSSLADWAERHRDPAINARMDQERRRMWRLIRETPSLDWLLLTKRPNNFRAMLPWMDFDLRGQDESGPFCRDCADNNGTCPTDGFPCDPREPWPNVWLGVTAGARSSLWRITVLRSTPAARRFVSGEPLLDGITGEEWDRVLGDPPSCYDGSAGPVHWLIVGDESGAGPGIRATDPLWVETALAAAERHGAVPHFKQWAGVGHPDIAGSLNSDRKGKIHLPIFRGRRYDGVPR